MLTENGKYIRAARARIRELLADCHKVTDAVIDTHPDREVIEELIYQLETFRNKFFSFRQFNHEKKT